MMRQLTSDRKTKVKEKKEKVKTKRELDKEKKETKPKSNNEKEKKENKPKKVKEKGDAAKNKNPAKKRTNSTSKPKKRAEFLASENVGIKLLYIHQGEDTLPKDKEGKDKASKDRLGESRSGLLQRQQENEARPRVLRTNVSRFGSSNSLSYESSPYSSPSPSSTPTRGHSERRDKRQQKYVLQGDSSDSSPNSTINRGRSRTGFYAFNDLQYSRSSFSSSDSSSLNTKVILTGKKSPRPVSLSRTSEATKGKAKVPKDGATVPPSPLSSSNHPPRIIYTENESSNPPAKNGPQRNKARPKKDAKEKDERSVSRWSGGDSGIDLFNLVGSAVSTVSSTASGSFLFDSTTSFSSFSPCCSPEEKSLGVIAIQNPIYEEQRSLKRSEIIKTANFGLASAGNDQAEEVRVQVHHSENGGGDSQLHPTENRSRTKDFIFNHTSYTIQEEDQKEEEDGEVGNCTVLRQSTAELPPPASQPLQFTNPGSSSCLTRVSSPQQKTDESHDSDSDTLPPPLPKNPPPPPYPYSNFQLPPPPAPVPPTPPHFLPPDYKSVLPESYSSPYFARSDVSLQDSRNTLESPVQDTSCRTTPVSFPSKSHGQSTTEASQSRVPAPQVAMLSDYEVNLRTRDREPKVKFYMKGEGKIGDAHDAPVKNFEILILDDQYDVESSEENWILRQSPYDKMSPASSTASPPPPPPPKKAKKTKTGTLTRVKNSLENLLQNQSSKARQEETANDSLKQKSEQNSLRKNKEEKENSTDIENGTFRLRGKDISRPFPLIRISPPDSHVEREHHEDTVSLSSESILPTWESYEISREGRRVNSLSDKHSQSTQDRHTNIEKGSNIKPVENGHGIKKGIATTDKRSEKDNNFKRELPKESHYIFEAPVQMSKMPARKVAQRDAAKLVNDNLSKVNSNERPGRPLPNEGRRVNDLRKYFTCGTNTCPKPRKGILKKGQEEGPSAPPVPQKKTQRKNSVTYSLPPPPSPATAARQVEAEVDKVLRYEIEAKLRAKPPPLPPKGTARRTMSYRGWRVKYEFLLGIVREPSRLLPDSLAKELQMVEAKRQGYAIERALVQANIDTWETMGGNKGRRLKDNRPESIRSLYEQVANLDCMLTSLETQIDVLSSVNNNLPKEFHDTFHDSGTSGHEPDSLEAIQTVVSGDMVEGGRLPPSPPDGDAEGGGGGGEEGGGGGRPSEAAVLLHLERCAHRQTRRCFQEMKERYEALQHQLNQRAIKVEHSVRSVGSALESLHIEHESTLNSLESLNSVNSNDRLVDELKLREMTISQLRTRVLQLEKDRLDKVPLDAAKEINRLNNNLIQLEKQRDELTLHNFTLKSQLSDVASKIHDPAATFQVNKDPPLSLKENGSLRENGNLKENGNAKSKNSTDDPDVVKVLRKATYKVSGDTQKLRQLCTEFDAKEEDYKKRIHDLETELRNHQNESTKTHDRDIREMENRMEMVAQKLEAAERYMAGKEEECNMLKLDLDTLNEENKRLKENLNDMMLKLQDYEEILAQKKTLNEQYSRILEEHRVLSEDFNRERVLRKKYYNQVEEMKGKIRVFCRVRPITESERRRGSSGSGSSGGGGAGDASIVVTAEDEYSVSLNTQRGGQRSFLFDRVFQQHEDQEAVFRDTHALVQSALDGYNVTIMAYGQTGSGKTYTMLGTPEEPGIAPRAFTRLFQLLDEGRARQEAAVSTYMLELYNDKLIDLLKPAVGADTDRLEIKRDKKGAVHVQGAAVRSVSSASELNRAFNEGLANRHTAATKMNVESSRSHLLIAVCLSITSKQTGSVLRGKLTLVDLAGSERVSKSGASSDQLKEANSINKSLSALGDVISALSSESSFVPYRNSKLTMLLQDSLGGTAKTLVFVNASPAAYNADETLISLMYATRIKQITNSVCKNADNKEITRLKSVISKLRKGEEIDEEALQ